jgi:hypothetical protein
MNQYKVKGEYMARPIKNNADYFPHDKDMRNDPKILAVRRKFGIKGYAVYNMIIELLTDSEGFEIEFTEINIALISGDFQIEPDLLTEVIGYCEFLQLLNFKKRNVRKREAGFLYCKELNHRMEPLLEKRSRQRKWLDSKEKKVIDSDNTVKKKLSTAITPQSKGKEKREEESTVKEKKVLKNKRFAPPNKQEVMDYIKKMKYDYVDVDVYMGHYESNGWKVGDNKMVSWKSSVAGWNAREKNKGGKPNVTVSNNSPEMKPRNIDDITDTALESISARDERSLKICDMYRAGFSPPAIPAKFINHLAEEIIRISKLMKEQT